MLAHRELDDIDKAFHWLGDALVTHVDDTSLDALDELANEIGDPKRAETVLNRALEEVFDGPLVRKLLARRAQMRRDQLDDKAGAAGDLKRLHDLSPSDSGVMDDLAQLYTELADWRGMVQLYEDQILRGKDANARAELARKVARLWEEKLDDPREAEADAIGTLLDMARKAKKQADGARKAEAEPFDQGKAEVQARYKPILDRCDLIASAAKKALAPFLAAQERAKREAEEKARAEAEAARKAAQEAFATAASLEEQEAAEAAAEAAKDADIRARVAAKDTGRAKGGARAISLRTTIKPEITEGPHGVDLA